MTPTPPAQEIAELIAQSECSHPKRTGGNDYLLCLSCDLMWDYRTESAERAVIRRALKALASETQARQEAETARIEAIQAWDRENELRRDAEEELAALKATTVSHATDVDDSGNDTTR